MSARFGPTTALLAVSTVALVVGAVGILLWRTRPQPAPVEQPAPRWPVVVRTLGRGTPPVEGADVGPDRGFSEPFGLAVGAEGALFVSDGARGAVYRVSPTGHTTLVAGGQPGFADGDTGTASFQCPSGLAVTPSGTLVVADTGNNAIRLLAAGRVTTLAGDGVAGDADGVGAAARFNGPIGVAVGSDGTIVVADTYNDRIRKVTPDGHVTTLAGGGGTGYRDGPADALFDTPTGVAIGPTGDVFVADTGNNAVRRIAPTGEVTTVAGQDPESDSGRIGPFHRPVGIAESGGYLYVTDGASRVVVLSPDGTTRSLAGGTPGFVDGRGADARFRGPTGICVDRRGVAWVADSDNDLVRRLTPPGVSAPRTDIDLDPVPKLNPETLGLSRLPWPVAPQDTWHELAATLGEARGRTGGDGRERLHNGIDVHADAGEVVRAVRDEMVQSPLAAGPFGDSGEWLRVGAITYIHIRVGRDARNRVLDPSRFAVVPDSAGVPVRVRVKRGTRFRVGDPIGTVNRLAHVHLVIGPRGAEVNPLAFGLPGFSDAVPPVIPAGGVDVYDETGARLTARRKGRLLVSGRVSVVAEAYDRVDGNAAYRRLGVYAIGYQVLQADGTPAPGFEDARPTIEFDRLPGEPDAGRMAYAQGSGITAYGSRMTRFRYIVTNTLRDGDVVEGVWDTTRLAPGEYTVRVTARDFAGNTVTRDLAVAVVGSDR